MKRFLTLLSSSIIFFSCAMASAAETVPAAATPAPAEVPVPAPVPSASPAPEKSEGFVLGGQLFIAFQNWSRVGTTGDSKIGVGVGGTLGVGYNFGDMKFLVGPQLWYNKWSQNYSNKSQSATSSVYVAMSDTGAVLSLFFDDFFIEAGMGTSRISSAMTVSGQEIAYGYDNTNYGYNTVSLGMKMNMFLFGIGMKNYRDLARHASHFNFMFGVGF